MFYINIEMNIHTYNVQSNMALLEYYNKAPLTLY